MIVYNEGEDNGILVLIDYLLSAIFICSLVPIVANILQVSDV